MTLDKIRKFLLTGMLITLLFPLIFVKTYSVTYSTLGTRTYSIPRFELFLIPLVFLVLTVLTVIWSKEIESYLNKKQS